MLDWLTLGGIVKDRARMGALLRAAFPASLEVESCEVGGIRRAAMPEDGTGALLANVRVRLRDRESGASALQLYSAHASAAAAALRERLGDAPLVPAALGPPLIHLPEADMVLLAFPNDPLLPQLPDCVTLDAAAECLRRLPEAAAEEILGFTADVLKYDPGRRCTLRFTLRTRGAAGEGNRTLIAKTHARRRTAKAFDTMTRLWSQWSAGSFGWSLARPLHLDEERTLLWQEALPGRSFWSAWPDLDVAAVFRRMAGVAAELHACAFARKERFEPHEAGGDNGLLARTFPELGRRHERLLERLEASRPDAGRQEPVSLHGDFHPNQFLLDGDAIGLTDFDRSRRGDPAIDLARFGSHVLLKALEGDLDPDAFRGPLEGFLDEYARRSPGWRRPGSYHWHLAAQLATRRVHKFLDHLADQPAAKIERMLDLACAALSERR